MDVTRVDWLTHSLLRPTDRTAWETEAVFAANARVSVMGNRVAKDVPDTTFLFMAVV